MIISKLQTMLKASVLMLSCIFIFVSCSQNESTAVSKDYSGEVKELTIGVVSFADTLEPTDQYFSWVVMRYGIGETLIKFDETMQPIPWLAESYEMEEDLLTWHFTIREGIVFSSGVELTAELIKASIERTFELSRRAEADFFRYETIEASSNVLTIKTASPVPGLPGCLADPLFTIVDTTADTSKFAMEGPVCTGPYVVTVFDKEKCIVVKNKNYWDGEVPFDKVTLLAIDDVNTRAMSLQAGEIDLAVNIGSSDLPLFTDNDDFEVHTIASLRTVLSFMNQENSPLADIRVRQAVISALDRETYADVLLNATFKAGKAPVPDSLDYGFDQLIDENDYNVSRAVVLLEEAGYTDTDGDGFVDKNGEKLSLRFVIYDSREELPVLAEALQISLGEIGIEVKIENFEYTTLLNMQEAGDYDLLIWNTITANTGDPETYLKEYWYTHSEDNRNANTAGYSNGELDKVLDALSVEFEPAGRKELIVLAQQIIMDDAASIFFAYPETNIISGKHVKGVKMYASDYYWLTKDIDITD